MPFIKTNRMSDGWTTWVNTDQVRAVRPVRQGNKDFFEVDFVDGKSESFTHFEPPLERSCIAATAGFFIIAPCDGTPGYLLTPVIGWAVEPSEQKQFSSLAITHSDGICDGYVLYPDGTVGSHQEWFDDVESWLATMRKRNALVSG